MGHAEGTARRLETILGTLAGWSAPRAPTISSAKTNPIPHDHLARDADRLRRTNAAVRRARERVHDNGRLQSIEQSRQCHLDEGHLDQYGPDPLRYYLASSMPENHDTDFTYEEFVRRNNDELVAT